MEQLTDLKAILHSKRANIYYLEKCRVMQKDGRVLYLTDANLDDVHCRIGSLEMSLMFTDTALQSKLVVANGGEGTGNLQSFIS
jgi:CRISPR/Cas system-associated endonuclease Cas1